MADDPWLKYSTGPSVAPAGTAPAATPPGTADPFATYAVPHTPGAPQDWTKYSPEHQARQQQTTPADPGFFHTLGKALSEAPQRTLDFLTGHPLEDVKQAMRDSYADRQEHLAKAAQAYKNGDYKEAADHAFFGFVPFLGPALGQSAEEWKRGQKGAAAAHALMTVGPALVDPAIEALTSDAAATAVTGAKGAIKGGAKAATEMVPLKKYGLDINVPKPLATATAGGTAARLVGLPGPVGAVVGGAAPIVRGMVRGARAAMTETPPSWAGAPVSATDIIGERPVQPPAPSWTGTPVSATDIIGERPVPSPAPSWTQSPVNASDIIGEPAEAPAAVTKTPGQTYAESEGYDWGKTSAKNRQLFEDIARAQANTAESTARPAPPERPATTQPPAEAPPPETPPAASSQPPAPQGGKLYSKSKSPHMEATSQFHALGTDMELPGSPAGRGLPKGTGTALARDLYNKNWSELTPGEIGTFIEFMNQNGALPNTSDLNGGLFPVPGMAQGGVFRFPNRQETLSSLGYNPTRFADGGDVDEDDGLTPDVSSSIRYLQQPDPYTQTGLGTIHLGPEGDPSFSEAMSRADVRPEWMQRAQAAINQPFSMPVTGGTPMSMADLVNIPQSKGEAALLAASALPAGKILKGARSALKVGTAAMEGAAPEVGALSRALETPPPPLRMNITAQDVLDAAAAGPGKFGSYAKYMERNPTAGEGLFDSSNPQPTFPNRPPVARYDPSQGRGRGPSARIVDAFNNPKVIEGLKDYARQGAEKLPADWYANDPLLNVYQQEWGPQAEEKFYQQMGHQAATSTGSAVPDNLRTGSLYNYMHEQGIPFPPKPPKGYGSKYQVAHRDTALNFRDTGTVDPLANPKRASFTENLMGNEDLLTADKHFMRLVGILSEDPRFLKTTAEVSRGGQTINIKPQEMFRNGQLTMEDAVKDPNLWVEAPNPNEYLHMENQYREKVAKPLGYTVANTQGKDWVGAGDVTGLGSPPESWIELLKHRVQYTADRLNADPQMILRKFVRGEIPLLEFGAAATGLGALTGIGQAGAPASDTDRNRTAGRPAGLQ